MERLREGAWQLRHAQAVLAGFVLSAALITVSQQESEQTFAELPADLVAVVDAPVAPQAPPDAPIVEQPPAKPRPAVTAQPKRREVSKPIIVPRTRSERFVVRHHSIAERVQQEYGVPIDLTLAMASHESDYGTSGLTRDAHAFFGIKANPVGFGAWRGPVYGAQTREVLPSSQLRARNIISQSLRSDGLYDVIIKDGFRSYRSDNESFLDYGKYLRTRGSGTPGDYYADAHDETNPVRYLKEILDDDDGVAGPQKRYATDPSYVEIVSDRIAEIQQARRTLRLG